MKKANDQQRSWMFRGVSTTGPGPRDVDCSVIAFDWFGQHFTTKHDDQNMKTVRYKNDVSFLGSYAVRSGFVRYGATAFFDDERRVIAIETAWNKTMYKVPRSAVDEQESNRWERAKWIWKTSVVVASHLVESIGKCRFVEINGFIAAVQRNLGRRHAVRRMVHPFIYGTISANKCFADLLAVRFCCIFHLFFAIFRSWNLWCFWLVENDGENWWNVGNAGFYRKSWKILENVEILSENAWIFGEIQKNWEIVETRNFGRFLVNVCISRKNTCIFSDHELNLF